MKFLNARFRKHVDVKPEGSATLGFLDLDAVDADGDVVKIHDITVRLTREGKPSLSAAGRSYKLASGETRRRASYRFGENTYERLLAGVFALGDVDDAKTEADALRSASSEAIA